MAERAAVQPVVIGWREYVDLPTWGITGLRAKIDTGARTSAIDVSNLVELGQRRVRFDVVLHRRKPHRHVTVEAWIARRTRIRSSLGHPHDRLIVWVPVRIGPVQKVIELGILSRSDMLCRMLLGRTALEGDFLVDPRHTYLFGPRPRKAPKRRRKPILKKRLLKDGQGQGDAA